MANASRRQVLRGLGSLLGASAVSQVAHAENAFAVAAAYIPRSDTAGSAGLVFTASQMVTLREICRLVIPATDSPGAHELDVHGFIDNQLFHCYDAGAQAYGRQLIDDINTATAERFDDEFARLEDDAQLELLTDLEWVQGGFSNDQRDAFKYLKNLLVFGYLTTEAGAKALLAYDPFPGGFKGSVPLESANRAWLGNVS